MRRSWFPLPGAGPRLGGRTASHWCKSGSRGGFSSPTGLCPQRSLHFPSVPFGDGQSGWSQLRVLRKRVSSALHFLSCSGKARQCFQVVTVTQKSCRQHLTFGACFGNENSSSYINTRVPHWDTVLRRGTGSHWCHDIKTVEDLPLLMVSKDVGSCSQRAGSSLTMQTRPVLFSWRWSWLRWRMPKRREDQSLVSVYMLAQWLVSPWRKAPGTCHRRWVMSCSGLYQTDGFFQQQRHESPWVLVSHLLAAAAVGSGTVMWDPSQLETPQLDTLVGYKPL